MLNALSLQADQVWKLAISFLLALPMGWDRELEDRTAGIRTGSSGLIDRRLQIGSERIELGLFRPWRPHRRHHFRTNFADDLFPDLCAR